jgi:hypothetical protein
MLSHCSDLQMYYVHILTRMYIVFPCEFLPLCMVLFDYGSAEPKHVEESIVQNTILCIYIYIYSDCKFINLDLF